MGNSAGPRPGYDRWVSFPGHGSIVDPVLNIDGDERVHAGYVTDLLNGHALDFVRRERDRPFALFLAHKAVHPDAHQAADGTLVPGKGGYLPALRHANLYEGERFPPRPNVMPAEDAVRSKPAFAESFRLREAPDGRAVMDWIQSGSQDEIRLRAQMMASVDEGVGALLEALDEAGTLDDTAILFLGDNGYFFGEHALGPERRFAYEEGIRTPFLLRYPRRFPAGETRQRMAMAIDIAPTWVELAGGTEADRAAMQGRSLLPLAAGDDVAGWRESFLCEYYSENAMPWLHGMTYKAVRTDTHKYIHWVQKSPTGDECDELYDLVHDPYEMTNLAHAPEQAATATRLRLELARLVADAVGLPGS
jgi:N-acetylglucosamine-6-sulfatase